MWDWWGGVACGARFGVVVGVDLSGVYGCDDDDDDDDFDDAADDDFDVGVVVTAADDDFSVVVAAAGVVIIFVGVVLSGVVGVGTDAPLV